MAWDRYVAPFSDSLWLAVAITVCALGVCLTLTNYGHENHRSLNLIATVFYIPACFCQQGKANHSYECLNVYFPLYFLVRAVTDRILKVILSRGGFEKG